MVKVEASVPPESTLEKVVDEDLNKFEEFFISTVGNTALTPSERAIIKTYLWMKLKG